MLPLLLILLFNGILLPHAVFGDICPSNWPKTLCGFLDISPLQGDYVAGGKIKMQWTFTTYLR